MVAVKHGRCAFQIPEPLLTVPCLPFYSLPQSCLSPFTSCCFPFHQLDVACVFLHGLRRTMAAYDWGLNIVATSSSSTGPNDAIRLASVHQTPQTATLTAAKHPCYLFTPIRTTLVCSLSITLKKFVCCVFESNSLHCYIVLYLGFSEVPLAVQTNQRRSQCEGPREKRQDLRERKDAAVPPVRIAERKKGERSFHSEKSLQGKLGIGQ